MHNSGQHGLSESLCDREKVQSGEEPISYLLWSHIILHNFWCSSRRERGCWPTDAHKPTVSTLILLSCAGLVLNIFTQLQGRRDSLATQYTPSLISTDFLTVEWIHKECMRSMLVTPGITHLKYWNEFKLAPIVLYLNKKKKRWIKISISTENSAFCKTRKCDKKFV